MPSVTKPTHVVTNPVRLSYERLLKPGKGPSSTEEKYSVTLLIPKSDTSTIQRINAGIQAAIQSALTAKWNGVKPAVLPTPIHDGDGVKQDGTPYGAECKGCYVLTASSSTRPGVVDVNCNPIIDQTQVYSGMYGRVSLDFFGYFNSGKKGVGAGLSNVQKTADGDPLSGRASAEDDFGADAPAWVNQAAAQLAQGRVNPITGQPVVDDGALPY
jgi:hypothetical protein